MNQVVYVVTAGEYSEYGIVRIFEKLEDAEKFCAIENDLNKDKPCYIETYDVARSESFQKVECHKAIRCDFSRVADSGFIWCVDWCMDYSKEPFELKFKRWDKCYGIPRETEYWNCVIPTMHTYNRYSDDDKIVNKILIDSFYIWRAMEEGIC